MISVIVVDDQKIIREGIKTLLANKTEIKVVADASNGKEAVEKVELVRPDVVLLDIDMPDIDGFGVISRIRDSFPSVKIIMLSSHEQDSYIHKATELGAKGYLLKNASSQELEWSIKLVNKGYSTIKSELFNKQLVHGGKVELEQSLNHGSDRDSELGSSLVAVLSEQDRANLQELEVLLAKNKVRKQYSSYKKLKKRRNFGFHSVGLARIKKTLTSFEFRVLVLITMFCIGFLGFIALS